MKEFIDKLTKKLYENVKSKGCPDEACWAHLNKNCDNCDSKEIEVTDVIRIVNELAEEYGKDTNVSTIDAGELFSDGWIPCSSGEMPKCGEFDIKSVWVTMHRKGIDFYFTRKICWNNYLNRWEWSNGKKMADDWEIIAWQYLEVPAPYQPEEQ